MLASVCRILSFGKNGICSNLKSYCNIRSSYSTLESRSTSVLKPNKANVAIFWDLDNKPPNSFPAFEAATKLKVAASSFGHVRLMVAYGNSHSFSHVPEAIRDQRKERKMLNQVEEKGVIKPSEPYLCRVCGRKFYMNEKLVNHFRQIHESEHKKRLSQIESAKGMRRVNLVAKYAMKMEKYKNAARDILTPRVGYGLADELKRAGFWVQTVSNKPEAADIALANHMIDVMDRRRAECLVLVSDDSDFVDVVKEAKLRCLKMVVVGDMNDGALKRAADVGFSWKEILMGKAKKEAVTVVSRWKDRDILKRLEWTYDPEVERKRYEFSVESDNDEVVQEIEGSTESGSDAEEDDDGKGWWELDSDSDVASKKLAW